MKKIQSLFLLLIIGVASMFADQINLPITGTPNGSESISPSAPTNKGWRTPYAPLICTIDFETAEVILPEAISDDVITFEVWNASGEVILRSFQEGSDFVDFLSSISGEYMVKFTTLEMTYIGYISL